MDTRLPRLLTTLAVLLALVGCARGPDAAGLRRDVQAQLDTLFGGRVLEVQSINRQGSAPLAAAQGAGPHAIVYYNAVLGFTAPYDPSDWAGLSPELIADALGATDEGVIGLGAGRMAAGAQLRAYGSMVYREAGETWQASLLPPANAKPAGVTMGTSTASDLIGRLAGIVNTTPGLHGEDHAIVAEELDHALQNIKLRLNRDGGKLIVATGPAGGEYSRFVESLRPRGADWIVSPATTPGSVENALLIDSGGARFGLVQSDVAAAAVTGRGAFSSHGPLRHLRAVSAMFPEPVHVVVRSDAGIGAMADLRGKRVALGSRGSGTRQTALQVLREHGLGHGDYVAVESRTPEEALQLLVAHRIDAVIEVVSAPWRQLASVAALTPLTLLPLDGAAMTRLTGSVPGLVPLAIPGRTYSGQQNGVTTLAATALLVAGSTVSDASVRQVLQFLYRNELAASRGASAARLSRDRALTGVTIPLHDGAADYFGAVRTGAPSAQPAP